MNTEEERTNMNNDWAVGAFLPKSIPSRSEEEISQLAKDIVANLVFTSDHVRRPNDLKLVFMPVILGAFSDMTEEAKKDIGMLYEYYKEASPRSVNGMPIFFSVRILNVKDRKAVWEKVKKIEEMLDSV